MTCPVCGYDPTTEPLTRGAAHAEGQHEGAQCLRAAILLVIGNFQGGDLPVLKRTLAQVCEQIVTTYDTARLRAIDRFVGEVQRRLVAKCAELDRQGVRKGT